MHKSLKNLNKNLKTINRALGDAEALMSGDKKKIATRFGSRVLGKEVAKIAKKIFK